ncbi:MAG: 16S rRNA (guanine(527)-N(7))-methyltransferase RsmG [Lachnospiraceae bacterium]|nr:16S rRNA (guanine(527)-N(7))-methyltransferase RsmG [Lachnospiraceae bacterium]
MDENRCSQIANTLNKLPLSIGREQSEQFLQYYNSLVQYNQVMNLTAITDFEEVIVKHFLDSAALVNIIDLNKVETIIDVGTGAGFPGIPLKILFPHLKITLLDSLQKRVKFLQTIAKELKMENIEVIHGRAEDLGQKKRYREQYDLCVSRAVANLSVLSEYCVPFVKVGGSFISYKAENIEEEVKSAESAIRILNCAPAQIFKITLPESSGLTRSFIRIEKKESLAVKYPRKAGLPIKKPL